MFPAWSISIFNAIIGLQSSGGFAIHLHGIQAFLMRFSDYKVQVDLQSTCMEY